LQSMKDVSPTYQSPPLAIPEFGTEAAASAWRFFLTELTMCGLQQQKVEHQLVESLQ
jgi:hypothetical protein